MTWKRLATYALGGVLTGVGALAMPVGGAGTVLVGAGVGLIGLATRWPGDRPKRKRPSPSSEDDVTEVLER